MTVTQPFTSVTGGKTFIAPINQSNDRSINQPINQSIIQSINP